MGQLHLSDMRNCSRQEYREILLEFEELMPGFNPSEFKMSCAAVHCVSE